MVKSEDKGYTLVPCEVLDRRDLFWEDKWLLVCLALRTRPDRRTCWPSLNTLCKQTGLSQSRVRRSLQRLREVGMLEVIPPRHGGKRTNTYVLNPVTYPAVRVPNWLLGKEELSPRQRMVVIAVLRHTNRRTGNQQWAQVSQQVLASILGISQRQVQLDLDALVNRYFVLDQKRLDRRKPNQYRIRPFKLGLFIPDPLVVKKAPSENGKNRRKRKSNTHVCQASTDFYCDSPVSEAVSSQPSHTDKSTSGRHSQLEFGGDVCVEVCPDLPDGNGSGTSTTPQNTRTSQPVTRRSEGKLLRLRGFSTCDNVCDEKRLTDVVPASDNGERPQRRSSTSSVKGEGLDSYPFAGLSFNTETLYEFLMQLPPAYIYQFEERAAIYDVDGGWLPWQAEILAMAEVLQDLGPAKASSSGHECCGPALEQVDSK